VALCTYFRSYLQSQVSNEGLLVVGFVAQVLAPAAERVPKTTENLQAMSITTETGVWYRKDEYDKLMDDFLRYRQALYAANGFLIKLGHEPVKLDYSTSQRVSKDEHD
jgi:hypothetical protein